MQNNLTVQRRYPPSVEKTIGFVDSHFWVLLSFILLLALMLRVIALYQLKQTPYFDFLLWDERLYHEWAKQIASGQYKPQTAYEFSPLPAYVMALVYWLFSPDIVYIRVLNIGFGLLTCLVIALLGKQIGGRSSGLAAGLIAALYAPFILYSIVLLKTALSVLSCALLVHLLLLEVRCPTAIKALLLGAVAGLAFNVRGNYNVFILLGAGAVVYSGWRAQKVSASVFCFALGLSLVMVPVAVRNYRLTGELILSTTQAGFNFYLGNNVHNEDPYYRPLPFASTSPFRQGVQFTIEASRRSGRVLTAGEASAYWYGETIHEGLEDPAAFLLRLFRKTLAVFNRFEAADHYDIDFLGQFMPIFKLQVANFTWVWPLGLAGLLLGLTTRRDLGWLAAVFLAYSLTLVAFFPNARYRVPLLAVLIPCVPLGISRFGGAIKRRDRKRVVLYVLLVIILAAVEFLPVRATNDRTAYYNTHAIVLYSSGRQEEAIRCWEISSEMSQAFSASANLALARVFFRKGDIQKAQAYLAKIGDSSYQAASKYHLLGDILQAGGQPRDAIEAYERSLAINSGDLEVRQKLIRLLNDTAPSEAFPHYRKSAEIAAFYKGL